MKTFVQFLKWFEVQFLDFEIEFLTFDTKNILLRSEQKSAGILLFTQRCFKA